ncbi:cysteine-rich secretory protein LCCL domain-containing 2-like [Lampetra fluviatilis]
MQSALARSVMAAVTMSLLALSGAPGASAFLSTNDTQLSALLSRHLEPDEPAGPEAEAGQRRVRRAIDDADKASILELHNKLRGQVNPPSSNMEYMTWDEELARSATSWAAQCNWDHGPSHLLPSIGQNLAVHWGRHRPPSFHVQAWYDEAKDYQYPYEQECNPWCPFRCNGAVCTHYTQLVWATTNRVGCAINTCYNMDVWGQIWEKAVYLVCNYSPKGNWIGLSPYKSGRACSECPPSYGGSCLENLCYRDGSYSPEEPEEEETNRVDYVQRPEQRRRPRPRPTRPPSRGRTVTSHDKMSQLVSCDAKFRDKCKGSTCNRYECPPSCLQGSGKVFGTLFYEVSSSICRAALHYGILDDEGGWVDITRQGRKPFFIKSQRNGVQALSKHKASNAFSYSAVSVKSVDCSTTVAQLCPYKKSSPHCPRMYCRPGCVNAESDVYGSKVYADNSSICRAAIHAGVITNSQGGYVDVMPVDKKNHYGSTHQNGILSKRTRNPAGGKAFRVFVVG